MAWPEVHSNAASARFALVAGQVVDHADHCLNAMRETLMCQADVTPIVWRTASDRPTLHYHGHSRRHGGDNDDAMETPPPQNRRRFKSTAQYNTMHTCRSYSD